MLNQVVLVGRVTQEGYVNRQFTIVAGFMDIENNRVDTPITISVKNNILDEAINKTNISNTVVGVKGHLEMDENGHIAMVAERITYLTRE